MTGYGRAEFNTPRGPVRIEIKTTNHRYFEFSSRLPQALLTYEEPIRKAAQNHIRRGKVYVNVTAPEVLVRHERLYVDDGLAREYMQAFKHLNRVLGTNEKVSVAQIAKMPDVITITSSAVERARAWKGVESGLLKALKALDVSRRVEGAALRRDIAGCASKIEAAVRGIRLRIKGLPAEINEELVRLSSHLKTLKATLSEGGEAGRKLDFIAQELLRETNTTSAKCNDTAVSVRVIEIKSELEKIREQAQNLE